MLNKMKTAILLGLMGAVVLATSCKKEEIDPTPDPIASFSFDKDANNFLKVTFTNLSSKATTYSWDFGDGSAAVTTESPEYTYSSADTYKVTLTATNADEVSDDFSLTITLSDPDAAIRGLVGEGTDGKVWQLIADTDGGFPYQIHPYQADPFVWWWALGDNVQLCKRDCLFNDTWTFKSNGTFVYDNKGDYYGEWNDLKGCFDATVADNWMDGNTDLNGWNSGTHDFVFDPTAATLTVTGGFIGIDKATPAGEVTVPAASIKYDVVKLVESEVDTLILDVVFTNTASSTGQAYWRSTLVSYGTRTPVTVGRCVEVAVTEPTAAAAAPTAAQADVISMFSDKYTDVAVDTWRTSWSNTDFEDVTIDGSAMKKYTAMTTVGIETTGVNSIDASSMANIYMDVWTPNATELKIKLVDFGADNSYAGGDDTEHELVFDAPAQESWNGLNMKLSDFTGMTSNDHISQLIISASPAGTAALFVDNVYFHKGSGGGSATAPTAAAPAPTTNQANVISMFSDKYTDVTVDTWRTDWSAATLEDVTIDGSDMKKYTLLDFVGIEATGANSIDASSMTHIHIDYWTPDATEFNVKLVDFGADNAFGGGDDSEHQVNNTNPTQGSWASLDISLADFTGLASSAHLSQLILVGRPVAKPTIFVDNVYFYSAL